MVTAELAVGLPALTLVLVLAVSVIAAAAGELRCADAAAGAARLAARGESAAVVTAFVNADAPAGARVAVSTEGGGTVSAVVTAPFRLPWLALGLPIQLTGQASQPLEPGVAGGS